jgi:hypothetical protein
MLSGKTGTGIARSLIARSLRASKGEGSEWCVFALRQAQGPQTPDDWKLFP